MSGLARMAHRGSGELTDSVILVAVLDDPNVLRRWVTAQRAEGNSENTIEIRMAAVAQLLRHAGRSLIELDIDDVRAWLAELGNAHTRNTYYRGVDTFFTWAVREGLCTFSPVSAIKAPPVPRGVPRPCRTKDLEHLLSVTGPPVDAMLLLGALQGLRAGEIAAVHGRHFDLGDGSMRVRGKGGVEAVLPLHRRVADLADRMPADGFWFPSRHRSAGHIRSERVSQLVRAACAEAGVPMHGAHPLRHWYATNLVRSGTDLRTTQSLMRHASLATTARYVEISDEARRAAVLRLPVLGGGHP